MSSSHTEEYPARKKQKSDSGTSRILRSQGKSETHSSKVLTSPSPATTPKKSHKRQRSMSESRRRSSRRLRNDELKDNEQNLHTPSTPRPTTPRKHSANEGSSSHKCYESDEAAEDEDMILREEHEDDDDEDSSGARQFELSRARAAGFGLSTMAGLLANQANQLKSLLKALKEPDPSCQLVALNELATILSMSTEDSLSGYLSIDAFVTELVIIMRGPDVFGEENPEMMLLACRCLANLMEALPASTANIVYGGAIPIMCQKLLEIQYIDLAEQALSTLEKISKEYPTTIVREGGLVACLTYLDFFSTNVQRIAVGTAANCAKNVPSDCFDSVVGVVPILQNIICGSDDKVVEAGCLCLTRLFESFKNEPKRLEQFLYPELLSNIINIVSPLHSSGHTVSTHIQTRFVHILGLCGRSSVTLAKLLLEYDLIACLYQLMTGLDKPHNSSQLQANSVVMLQALIHRPREQINEILHCMSDLLPGLPAKDFPSNLSTRERGAQDNRNAIFAAECAAQYLEFTTIVLPTLMDIYNSTVNASLRKTTLLALLKICHNLEPKQLIAVVEDVPLAAFITGILGASDLSLVICGLRLANVLLDRVSNIYCSKLAFEGCIAEIESLAAANHSAVTTQASSDLTLADQGTSDHLPSLPVEHNKVRQSPEQINNFGLDQHADDDEDDDDDDEDADESDGDVVESDEDALAIMEEYEMDDPTISPTHVGLSTDRQLSASNQAAITQRSEIKEIAASCLQLYQTSRDREGKDENMTTLKGIAHMLNTSKLLSAYTMLSQLLCSQPISSYYLRASGLLDALLHSLADPQKLENRQLFSQTMLTSSAFSILLGKLQELLSRAEKFEVITTSTSDEKRSANVLAKQLRLKLVADETSEIPKPYRNIMVSIHAIATFKALDDYLRPRVMTNMQISKNRSSSTPNRAQTAIRNTDGLSGALAQLAAAGGSLPDSIRERLAHLGVDTGLGLQLENSPTTPDNKDRSRPAKDSPSQLVSVEVEGDRAVAKDAAGHRIATPRSGTPNAGGATQQSGQARASKPTMSYAAALSSTPLDAHIEFEVAGQAMSHDTTIYGGVRSANPIGDASTHNSVVSSVYQVKFRLVPGPAPTAQSETLLVPDFLPEALDCAEEARPILQLLDVLHMLKSHWKDLYEDAISIDVKASSNMFINTKLTAKLNRQLEEPLIVASSCLPRWSQDLPRFYPFLFPFETRYLFLQSTSFGYSRSMSRWQAAVKKDRDDGRPMMGRLQRQKVRIMRSRMLESAMKVLELYGASPSMLEVEYFDEVGTGLGPTLEFYSMVSKEFCKKRLDIWRDSHVYTSSEYVYSSNGLFPQPLARFDNEDNQELAKKSLALFKSIGTFIARAMLDSRLIDLPLNPAFFSTAQATSDLPLTIGKVYSIDKGLAKSLTLLSKFAYSYDEIMGDETLNGSEKAAAIASIKHDKVSIDELGLDFTYPGSPELELIEAGAQQDVTITNVGQYVHLVIDFTLGAGIAKQITAFKEGFSMVFPFTALRAFTPEELTSIFGHSEEDWSANTLLESIKADHGYTIDSSTIRDLVTVLSELNETDRRAFLQFITGSPKLPIGGFKALTPQFTIVCKPHEPPLSADDYLPSVMTCVNYLKLPDYSSITVLQSRLMTAITEGGGSFHLS